LFIQRKFGERQYFTVPLEKEEKTREKLSNRGHHLKEVVWRKRGQWLGKSPWGKIGGGNNALLRRPRFPFVNLVGGKERAIHRISARREVGLMKNKKRGKQSVKKFSWLETILEGFSQSYKR